MSGSHSALEESSVEIRVASYSDPVSLQQRNLGSSMTSSSASFRAHTWIFDKYDYVTALKAVFGLVIVGVNTLTLVGLQRARGLKRPLRLGLINLALTDLVAGLVFTYHAFALRYLVWYTVECDIRYAVVVFILSVTVNTLLMMSLDRFFALYLPYRYDAITTSRNLYVWIGVNWLVAVGFSVAGIVETTDTLLECNFLVNSTPAKLWMYSLGTTAVVGTILALQAAVFAAAIRHVRKIVPTMPLASGGGRKLLIEVRMHMKATVTTAIVVAPCLLLTMPLVCYFFFLAVHPEERVNGVNLYLVDGGLFLMSLNSLVNPAIYIWRLSAVRGPLQQILCQRCQSKKAPASKDQTTSNRTALEN